MHSPRGSRRDQCWAARPGAEAIDRDSCVEVLQHGIEHARLLGERAGGARRYAATTGWPHGDDGSSAEPAGQLYPAAEAVRESPQSLLRASTGATDSDSDSAADGLG